MLANKNEKFQIKENEKSDYHLLITKKVFNHEKNDMDITKTIHIFDPKGFDQFKKFKPAGIGEVEILHDPIYQEKLEKKAAKIEADKKVKLAAEKKAEEKAKIAAKKEKAKGTAK